MNRKFYLIALATLASFSALAGVKVTSLGLKTEGPNGFVNVSIEGISKELPDIKVYGRTIEVTFSGAEPFSAIHKTVSGAILSANVLNGKAVVKAILPYEINAEKVNLGGNNNLVEVAFPRGTASPMTVNNKATTPAVAAIMVKPTLKAETKTQGANAVSKVSKDHLNEDYLNNLMKEDSKTAARDTDIPKEVKNDEIKVKQASAVNVNTDTKANNNLPSKVTDNFSFAGYAAKFSIFLALVLGLFYGVVQLLKKGVFNRGKLGFLNNSQMIEVLSTTYIAPKKSLMIVRAHKQLFLVSNSETGLQFLAEMNDTTGLIKEGEKLVTGVNFDLNMNNLEANENAPVFKIKEDITQSAPEAPKGLSKIAVAQDIVKFSDELKKKAKKLKPIEFN